MVFYWLVPGRAKDGGSVQQNCSTLGLEESMFTMQNNTYFTKYKNNL